MLARQVSYYRALERDARRPLGQAAHPNDCPKLRLHGVDFALPPRQTRIVPRFGPEGVGLVARQAEEWPEMAALRQAPAERAEMRNCPACRQPVVAGLQIDLVRDRRILARAFAVAAKALRGQYRLTDEQLTDLLTIAGDPLPEWLGQIVRYCCVLPTEGGDPPRADKPPARPRGLVRRLLGR